MLGGLGSFGECFIGGDERGVLGKEVRSGGEGSRGSIFIVGEEE